MWGPARPSVRVSVLAAQRVERQRVWVVAQHVWVARVAQRVVARSRVVRAAAE
jgi:hypothetical protein